METRAEIIDTTVPYDTIRYDTVVAVVAPVAHL